MNENSGALRRKMSLTVAILLASLSAIAFGLVPKLPINSTETTIAYNRYRENPSEVTQRNYYHALDRAARPVRIAEYSAALLGITLPLLLVRVWRRNGRSRQPGPES